MLGSYSNNEPADDGVRLAVPPRLIPNLRWNGRFRGAVAAVIEDLGFVSAHLHPQGCESAVAFEVLLSNRSDLVNGMRKGGRSSGVIVGLDANTALVRGSEHGSCD